MRLVVGCCHQRVLVASEQCVDQAEKRSLEVSIINEPLSPSAPADGMYRKPSGQQWLNSVHSFQLGQFGQFGQTLVSLVSLVSFGWSRLRTHQATNEPTGRAQNVLLLNRKTNLSCLRHPFYCLHSPHFYPESLSDTAAVGAAYTMPQNWISGMQESGWFGVADKNKLP
jgi:hypothetical protein